MAAAAVRGDPTGRITLYAELGGADFGGGLWHHGGDQYFPEEQWARCSTPSLLHQRGIPRLA